MQLGGILCNQFVLRGDITYYEVASYITMCCIKKRMCYKHISVLYEILHDSLEYSLIAQKYYSIE